ncbi:nuclear transport factor 2 family protein [Nonomuraea roseoviolacea]|uniref:Ketosteroid isomerase-like protein n=1 Tax=Nonomuraea roseoviolacea subsp. carminata TaxID=160689 RepID=A0ABT1JZN8_9ACTN|nr:nuclear transport factor 2 family protein [Nonomuraea roseoviolacea]MCP2346249.1 ketosteroid isomerase-like protein [Nonomuraea roseoviolacea subsp. carminata]
MSIEETVAAFHRAMLHKSADELADLYAEEGVHEFPFGGLSPLRGREEVRAAYRGSWSQTPAEVERVRMVALHATADPEVVVVEQEADVTVAGNPITVPGLLVLRVRDGRIVHTRDYMDTYAISRIRAAAA